MKKTKIIIPTLGLLLLSTAASVSSTVAWFAMNASVQANGMQITAKSDSSFLVIGTVNNLATVQGANAISADLSAANATVYPVAHDAIANTAAATALDVSNPHHYKNAEETTITIDEYNALDDKSGWSVVNQDGTNWYYQVANAVTASTSTKQKNYLVTLDANYIIHQTVYVTMAAGSNDASNLKIKSANISVNNSKNGDSETFEAVKVLVTSSSNAVEFDNSTKAASATTSAVLATSVTSAALIPLDIFVYYDGNHSSVFTNNIANLEGAIVNLTFDVNRA